MDEEIFLSHYSTQTYFDMVKCVHDIPSQKQPCMSLSLKCNTRRVQKETMPELAKRDLKELPGWAMHVLRAGAEQESGHEFQI